MMHPGLSKVPSPRVSRQARGSSIPVRPGSRVHPHPYPAAISAILRHFQDLAQRLDSVFDPTAEAIFARTKAIHVTATGRSYHAGLVACSFIERFCRIPARIELAGGYTFRRPIVVPGTLFLAISAPGERREALAALKVANASNYVATLAVTVAEDPSMRREADLVLSADGAAAPRCAAPAFLSQLVAVGQLTAQLAKQLRSGTGLTQILTAQLDQLTDVARDVMTLDAEIEAVARGFRGKDHVLYVGHEGALHPVTMDGALQLKRASRVHAEALAASEMKYGSLELVNEDTPVVALVPNDELHESLMASLGEVRARRGLVYLFADASVDLSGFDAAKIVRIPRRITCFQAPVAYSIALEMLIHHVTRQQSREPHRVV